MKTIKKAFALCLAFLMTAQVSAVAGAADVDLTSDYSGTVLAAVNTNYGDISKTFSAVNVGETKAESVSVVKDEKSSDVGFIDAVLDDIEPLSPEEAAIREAALGKEADQKAKAADYHIGDKKRIDSDDRKDRYVDVSCFYVGEKCTVWAEGKPGDEEKCIALGEYADSTIDKELDLFGDKRIDTDGDGKIAIFHYALDKWGGYFYTKDLADKYGRIGKVWMQASNGNACDCVHIDSEMGRHYTFSCFNHEYQHYLNACYCFAGKNNLTCLRHSESYINEGFSTCAEYVLHDDPNKVWSFDSAAKNPEERSLVNWGSSQYGLSFVFAQYIRTRYATLTNDTESDYPGKWVYKKVLESRNKTNDNNTLGIIADILYPKDMYPELKTKDARCRRLLTDFWIAVFCREDEGIYGFNGEEWANDISPDEYLKESLPSNGSTKIRSSMASFYLINGGKSGTAKVTKAQNGLAFVGIDYKYNVLEYDANGGTDAPESSIFRSPRIVRIPSDVPSRFGFTFRGWSKTKDAETPDHRPGSSIDVSGQTTLYAVWKEAEKISLDTTYTKNTEFSNQQVCFFFTPKEDGAYTVKVYPNTYTEMFTGDGEIEHGYSDEKGYTFELKAGTEYEMIVYSTARSFRFSVTKEISSFKLTFDFCVDGVKNTTMSGRDSYSVIENYSEGSEAFKAGYNFAGWSKKKNSATADYKYPDKIEVTSDTTLYAVWIPAPEIKVDVPVAPGERIYRTFTPESDGTYCITSAKADQNENADYEMDIHDEKGRFIRNADDGDGVCLAKGTTYYILAKKSYSFGADHGFVIKKLSDEMSITLTYDMGDDSVGSFVQKGKASCKIPRFSPVSLTGRKFLGWAKYSNEERPEYKAGDTILVTRDTFLYPVWSGEKKTSEFVKNFYTAVAYVRLVLFIARTAVFSPDRKTYKFYLK
ncbi:MAG: InlB B-repeat-containing protein [Clostridiales bacterium]|nr:InlB B-repeat-containing protein [Clostridiales bacterium]